MLLAAFAVQALLAFPCGPAPVRFGVPLPSPALATGLSLRGEGSLQWRRLPLRAAGDLCWVEIAVDGGGRTVRIHAGTVTAADDRRGAACIYEQDGGRERWRWRDGTEDVCTRTVLAAPAEIDGELYAAGEAVRTESPGLAERARAAGRLPRAVWEAAGLLPPDQGLARELRAHLQQLAQQLVELPGARGAGDYARSGGVVTNLEFDTPLALLRLGLALGDEELLLRARRSALHLIDRDLDARTGLPFPHGPGHRTGRPEPGHAWVQGVLWVGAVTADDQLLGAARQLARALTAQPPAGDGPTDRARDYGWPLGELEACLQLLDDPVLAAAAARLAAAIGERFDPAQRTFRFGEGEQGDGVYFERAWLLGGIVLPALEAHLRRCPDRELQRRTAVVTQGLLDRLGRGALGVPTHWRWRQGLTFAVHYAAADPKALMLLEALPPADLQRLFRRERLWAALRTTPAADDPDLATSLTMVARCSWVYR